jgi:hypothetical protein
MPQKLNPIHRAVQFFILPLLSVTLVQATSAQPLDQPSPPAKAGKLLVLLMAKSRPSDPPAQRLRAHTAVQELEKSLRSRCSSSIIEVVMDSLDQKGPTAASNSDSTKSKFLEKLGALARAAGSEDTVLIYTHTHGIRPSPARNIAEGGLVVRDNPAQSQKEALVAWSEYADFILGIPAKNVIVFTMSCFSGGLVDLLNSQQIRPRWQSRRKSESRNFIVVTSQNSTLPSGPVSRAGQVVNPFAEAVARAVEGLADGSSPSSTSVRDGVVSAGELVSFVLNKTRLPGEAPGPVNQSDPQSTGSYGDDSAVLSPCQH